MVRYGVSPDSLASARTAARSPRFKRLDDGHLVYEAHAISVREYQIARDGVAGTYSIVERPDSVIVIPLTPTHRTLLLKQFRFPANAHSWELPMGGVDSAEHVEAAARRELAEEVGLETGELVRIGEYRASPGLSRQKVTVFVAMTTERAVEASTASSSTSDEIEEVSIVTVSEVAAMIRDGRVTDGFSLAGFLLLRSWLDERERSDD